MEPLLIAKITNEMHRYVAYATEWVISISYPERPEFPFIVYRTGNADEAQAAPANLAEFLGYSADQVEVRHLY